MKKISLIVLVALMAFAGSVFAQDAVKPVGQEKAKTTEVKKEEPKADVKKSTVKPAKKHRKKAAKAEVERK